ncbi:MAG: MFS transporter [Caldilineaceae bacterium]|nr:MFS transporter [Caldilineaceae bacterium]
MKQLYLMRSFNSDVKRLLGFWALNSFAYFGIASVLMNLYILRLGLGIEFIGFFNATGQMIYAITSIPAGAVAQRIGLRTSLLFGCVLAAGSMSLLLLVEWLPQTIWQPWLVVCWSLGWIGGAFATVVGTPYMMLATRTAEERGQAFATQAAVVALMGFVGGAVAGVVPGLIVSLLGGSLEDATPYRLALWLNPLTYLLAFFVFAPASPLRLEEQQTDASTQRPPLRLFTFLGGIVLITGIGSGAARGFFNLFLDTELGVHPGQIGFVIGLGQLLPVLMVTVTPLLLARLGSAGTLAAVGVVVAAGLGLMGLSTHWLLAAVGFALVFSAMAANGPAVGIFSQELVSSRWRTLSSAVINVGIAVGWAASSALGGALISAVGFRTFYFVSAAISFAATPILLAYRRGRRARVPATATN